MRRTAARMRFARTMALLGRRPLGSRSAPGCCSPRPRRSPSRGSGPGCGPTRRAGARPGRRRSPPLTAPGRGGPGRLAAGPARQRRPGHPGVRRAAGVRRPLRVGLPAPARAWPPAAPAPRRPARGVPAGRHRPGSAGSRAPPAAVGRRDGWSPGAPTGGAAALQVIDPEHDAPAGQQGPPGDAPAARHRAAGRRLLPRRARPRGGGDGRPAVLVVATADAEGDADLTTVASSDVSGRLPAGDCVVALAPDGAGGPGSPPPGPGRHHRPRPGRIQVLALEEPVANPLAVDPEASTCHHGRPLPAAGRPPAPGGGLARVVRPRHPDQARPADPGQRQRPALLPGGLVALTDNAEPRMHVVVRRRSDGARSARGRCSAPTRAPPSPTWSWSGDGVVVTDNHGYGGLLSTPLGPRHRARGHARRRPRRRLLGSGGPPTWSRRARGPTLSPATGLLYADHQAAQLVGRRRLVPLRDRRPHRPDRLLGAHRARGGVRRPRGPRRCWAATARCTCDGVRAGAGPGPGPGSGVADAGDALADLPQPALGASSWASRLLVTTPRAARASRRAARPAVRRARAGPRSRPSASASAPIARRLRRPPGPRRRGSRRGRPRRGRSARWRPGGCRRSPGCAASAVTGSPARRQPGGRARR